MTKEMVGGCCVCSDESGSPENPLVYCDGDGCNVAVHQACYGIVSVPQGPWFCKRCESQERAARARCELCPSKHGAFKRTDTGHWAHVVCALYIPEVRFGNVTTMEPIMIEKLPKDRFGKNCYICKEQGKETRSDFGACMQCNKSNCSLYFHVTCAQAAGLLCEEAGNLNETVKYCGYCRHHYKKLMDSSEKVMNKGSSTKYTLVSTRPKDYPNIKPIPAFKPIPNSTGIDGYNSSSDSSPPGKRSPTHGHHDHHHHSSGRHRSTGSKDRDLDRSNSLLNLTGSSSSSSSSTSSSKERHPSDRSIGTSGASKAASSSFSSSATNKRKDKDKESSSTGGNKSPKRSSDFMSKGSSSSASASTSLLGTPFDALSAPHPTSASTMGSQFSLSSYIDPSKLAAKKIAEQKDKEAMNLMSKDKNSSSSASASSASAAKDGPSKSGSSSKYQDSYHHSNDSKSKSKSGDGTKESPSKDSSSKDANKDGGNDKKRKASVTSTTTLNKTITSSSGLTSSASMSKTPSFAKTIKDSSKDKNSSASATVKGGKDGGKSASGGKNHGKDGGKGAKSSTSGSTKRRISDSSEGTSTSTEASDDADIVRKSKRVQGQSSVSKDASNDKGKKAPAKKGAASAVSKGSNNKDGAKKDGSNSTKINGNSSSSKSGSKVSKSKSVSKKGIVVDSDEDEDDSDDKSDEDGDDDEDNDSGSESNSDVEVVKKKKKKKMKIAAKKDGVSSKDGPASNRRSSTETSTQRSVARSSSSSSKMIQNGFLSTPSPSPSLTPRSASHGHDVDMNRNNNNSNNNFSIPLPPLKPLRGVSRTSIEGQNSNILSAVAIKEPTEPSATSLEMLLERQWTQSAHFVMDQASHYDVANLMSVLNNYRNENERLEERLRNLTSRRDHLSTVNARLALPLNGTFASFNSTMVTSTSSVSGPSAAAAISGLSIPVGLSGLPGMMSSMSSAGIPMAGMTSGGGPGQPVPGLSLANFLPPHAPSLSGLINSANAGLRGVPNPNNNNNLSSNLSSSSNNNSSTNCPPTEPFTINGQRFPMIPSEGPSSMYQSSSSHPFQGLMAAAMAARNVNNSSVGSGSSTSASPSPFGGTERPSPSPFGGHSSSGSMNAINSMSNAMNMTSTTTQSSAPGHKR